MVLNIKRLYDGQDDSIPFGYELDLSHVKRWGDMPFPHPAHVEGVAASRTGIVTVEYTVRYRMVTVCDRCLSPIDRECSQHFEHTVVEKLYEEDNTEFTLCEDGLLDLDELVTSDILLELPIRMVCREDCKGLCPKCGTNLNESSCGCDTRQIDPRLEALRKLLD